MICGSLLIVQAASADGDPFDLPQGFVQALSGEWISGNYGKITGLRAKAQLRKRPDNKQHDLRRKRQLHQMQVH